MKEKRLAGTRWQKMVGLLGIEQAMKGGNNECA